MEMAHDQGQTNDEPRRQRPNADAVTTGDFNPMCASVVPRRSIC